ncbi:heterokaryon incompatibility protein-domain-containing protein, partial [Trametes polyzona]
VLDVGSDSALSLAKVCLRECVDAESGHDHCQVNATPHTPTDALPTRLVDCTNIHHPRLVETKDNSACAGSPYLALSYVWGAESAQRHRTTNANINTYIAVGIEATTLPQTIRDAVYVTHALGFRYLWLDSLCIIQDSGEDKHREMAHMRHIYRHAHLTIIAASASSASEGFLQDRSVSNHRTFAVPVVCPVRESLVSTVETISESLSQAVTGTIHFQPTEEERELSDPIDRRAWCLQEITMSPRSLIFSSTTLVYRCQAEGRSIVPIGQVETRPDRSSGYTLPQLLRVIRNVPSMGTLDRHEPALPYNNDSQLRYTWWEFVQAYSRRSLSYPSDKLVAFAGLAEEFHQQKVTRLTGADYLAGLWRDTLLRDLLWFVDHAFKPFPSTRPRQYRAPSWSWAAVDGAIVQLFVSEHSNDRPTAEVVECVTTLEDERLPFGEVCSGHLVLRAPLM